MKTTAVLVAALMLGAVPMAYGATATVTVNKIDENSVGAAIGTLKLEDTMVVYGSHRIFRACLPALTAFTSMSTPIAVQANRAGPKWQGLRQGGISIR